jgi:hypothetical protein
MAMAGTKPGHDGGGAISRVLLCAGPPDFLGGAARQYAFSDFSSANGVLSRIRKSNINDQFSM